MSDQQSDTTDSNPEKGAPLGEDGTIPNSDKGVAVGHTEEASNFNAEEDEESDED